MCGQDMETKVGRSRLPCLGGEGTRLVPVLLSGLVGKTQNRAEEQRNPTLPVLLLASTGTGGEEEMRRKWKKNNQILKLNPCRVSGEVCVP